MAGDVTNQDRAGWALIAAEAFGRETNQVRGDGYTEDTDEPLDEIIGDLIADLYHLAKREGIDPKMLSDRAMRCFEAEEQDDGA